MDNIDSGYVWNWRKIEAWEWYKTPNMAHLLQHLIRRANRQDKQWQGILIKRGQVLTSLPHLSEQTGISVRSIRTCLDRLKSTGEITNTSTNKYRILTLCHYDTYQAPADEADRQIDRQPDRQLTGKRQTTDRQLTANNNHDNHNNQDNTIEDWRFPLADGKEWLIDQERFARYEKTYQPKGISVRHELTKAEQWLLDHKANRKTERGMPAFLTGWLNRAKPTPDPDAEYKTPAGVWDSIEPMLRAIDTPAPESETTNELPFGPGAVENQSGGPGSGPGIGGGGGQGQDGQMPLP